jgi:hypothetical protein
MIGAPENRTGLTDCLFHHAYCFGCDMCFLSALIFFVLSAIYLLKTSPARVSLPSSMHRISVHTLADLPLSSLIPGQLFTTKIASASSDRYIRWAVLTRFGLVLCIVVSKMTASLLRSITSKRDEPHKSGTDPSNAQKIQYCQGRPEPRTDSIGAMPKPVAMRMTRLKSRASVITPNAGPPRSQYIVCRYWTDLSISDDVELPACKMITEEPLLPSYSGIFAKAWYSDPSTLSLIAEPRKCLDVW